MGEILHAIGFRWQLILTQLLGFLIVFFVLRSLLFGRIHKVLEDRAAEEERRRGAIALAKKEAEAARARFSARDTEIGKQAYERTQAEVRAGLKRKSEIVGAEVDLMRKEVALAREKLSAQHAAALARLREDVVALTVYLAGAVAGRKADSALAAQAERAVDAAMAAAKRPVAGGAS